MADVFETTDYIVRGDTHSNGSTNPLASQFSALANGVGTGDQTPTDSELLLTCVNGAWYVKAFSALWDYISSKLTTNTPSHIGQIIHSTTLATLEDVQAVYGSDTTWIQHSGYILRGASSGVTDNNAVKDGGEDTHTLTINEMPSHTHPQNSHNHSVPGYHYAGTYSAYNRLELQGDGNLVVYNSSTGSGKWSAGTTTSSGSHTARAVGIGHNDDGNNTTSKTATNQNTGGGAAHNIMQSYKNVYIWERTS